MEVAPRIFKVKFESDIKYKLQLSVVSLMSCGRHQVPGWQLRSSIFFIISIENFSILLQLAMDLVELQNACNKNSVLQKSAR